MAVHPGAAAASALYLGASPVKRAYLGTTKVWQTWLPARGNMTADLQGNGQVWIDVPTLSAGNTDTVISGSPPSIVVQGANASATVAISCGYRDGSFPDNKVRILRNGSVVSTSSGGATSLSWSGSLVDGDLIRFQYWGEGAFNNRPYLLASSYIAIA